MNGMTLHHHPHLLSLRHAVMADQLLLQPPSFLGICIQRNLALSVKASMMSPMIFIVLSEITNGRLWKCNTS